MHSNSVAQQSQCTGQNNTGKCMIIFIKGNYVNYTAWKCIVCANSGAVLQRSHPCAAGILTWLVTSAVKRPCELLTNR